MVAIIGRGCHERSEATAGYNGRLTGEADPADKDHHSARYNRSRVAAIRSGEPPNQTAACRRQGLLSYLESHAALRGKAGASGTGSAVTAAGLSVRRIVRTSAQSRSAIEIATMSHDCASARGQVKSEARCAFARAPTVRSPPAIPHCIEGQKTR